MSKPLSEQVAELEAEIRDHKIRFNRLKFHTDWMREEWKKSFERQAERDRLRAAGDLAQERLYLVRAEKERLEAENATLRAGQGTWPDGDSPAGEQVPRVISAAELIHGMWVAGKREDGTWTAGTVNGNSSIISRSGLRLGALEDFGHFVLLEDAPTSDDDDDPAPRLTVHALNTAPVGSVVISGALVFTKNHDGDWISNDPALGYVPHEIAAITPDANATLTYPEATP